MEPFSCTFILLAQTVMSLPASTIGTGLIVMLIVSIATPQFPLPVDTRIMVTAPAVASPDDGTYAALSELLFGINVPVPDVVHWPPGAAVTEPLRYTVSPAQIV